MTDAASDDLSFRETRVVFMERVMKDMSKRMELMHKQIEKLWLDRQVFDMNKKMELMQHHIEVAPEYMSPVQTRKRPASAAPPVHLPEPPGR